MNIVDKIRDILLTTSYNDDLKVMRADDSPHEVVDVKEYQT